VQNYLIPFSGAGLGDIFRYRGSGSAYNFLHLFSLKTISFNKGQEYLPHVANYVLNNLIILPGFITTKNILILLTGG